ncbi:LppM family (lipo)protein [Helcobacillus massiliensis]|uniref:LppM family (lipo)protein n=1 Tax=Helcobacillus massiliensis TaxID=521392 RepID=UPI002552D9D9|nr:hypothetical protein [Helcobacillus massiliensis]MDK7741809.1 hypothetical protein [Helcobacillus massiliensis]WOO93000.1 hypothetical protein R3I40_11465 [Helcobacillus massiliensis]
MHLSSPAHPPRAAWRRLLAVLLAPLLLLTLAACGELKGEVDFEDESTVSIDLTLKVDQKTAAAMAFNRDSVAEFCEDTKAEEPNTPGLKVTPIASGGDSGCHIEYEGTHEMVKEMLTLEENGKALRLVTDEGQRISEDEWNDLVKNAREHGIDLDDAKVDVEITMPGKVLSSVSGEIDGDTVRITNLHDLLTQGVNIKSEVKSGFPWGAIVTTLLVLLLLAALAAAAFFFLRRRRGGQGKQPTGSPAAPGQGGAHAPPQAGAGAAAVAAPQHPQHPQAPGQPQAQAHPQAPSAPQVQSPPQAQSAAPAPHAPSAPPAPTGQQPLAPNTAMPPQQPHRPGDLQSPPTPQRPRR